MIVQSEIREMVKEVYGHLYETNPHIRAITREIEAGQKEQLNLGKCCMPRPQIVTQALPIAWPFGPSPLVLIDS
jgi:hypothetical protein